MKRQVNPIDKFKPLWEGGKSVEQYNIKVGFKIRMFCVNELNSLRQKNPQLFGQKETEQLTKMIMDLKQDKGTISVEDQTCNLEDYQQFLSEFFQKVDYEDRHGTVTVKTSSKFRVMASFIDVLASWGPIDPEMLKCKKYCQFKAVDIFKALKKGEVPKRGGPKEQENANPDSGLGNEIEELSKNMDNTNLGNNNNNNFNNNNNNNNFNNNNNYNNNNNVLRGANNNDQYMTSYHSGGNNNNFQNNLKPNNDQYMTSYHSGGNNPYGQGQQFNKGGNMNSNGFSNPFGNNNNMQPQQHHQQPNSARNNQNQYQSQNHNQINTGNTGMNKARKSKVFPSADRNPQKRTFKGKYELNAVVPIKYNSVDYFMLVENVRINNENALRELKRGKARDILNTVLDSLEFLSYIHK